MAKSISEWLSEVNDNHNPQPQPQSQDNYQTVVRQLNSISWQLKRIADALENKQ